MPLYLWATAGVVSLSLFPLIITSFLSSSVSFLFFLKPTQAWSLLPLHFFFLPWQEYLVCAPSGRLCYLNPCRLLLSINSSLGHLFTFLFLVHSVCNYTLSTGKNTFHFSLFIEPPLPPLSYCCLYLFLTHPQALITPLFYLPDNQKQKCFNGWLALTYVPSVYKIPLILQHFYSKGICKDAILVLSFSCSITTWALAITINC